VRSATARLPVVVRISEALRARDRDLLAPHLLAQALQDAQLVVDAVHALLAVGATLDHHVPPLL